MPGRKVLLLIILALGALYISLYHINIRSFEGFRNPWKASVFTLKCLPSVTVSHVTEWGRKASTNSSRIVKAEKVLQVMTSCKLFLDRVQEFNIALNLMRSAVLQERINNITWNGTTGNSVSTIVWGGDDDFLDQLDKFSYVKTLMLPWKGIRSNKWTSLSDYSNLLIREYFDWSANEPLCTWIETPGATGKMNYDIQYNKICNRFINSTNLLQSLRPVYLNMKPVIREWYKPVNDTSYPRDFYELPSPYVFYVHFIVDAVVTSKGEVFSHDMKLVPYGCHRSYDLKLPHNQLSLPHYDEVYVITQYWGSATFHRMVEIVPRLASSLEFLQRNSHIKIVAPPDPDGRLTELVQIIGLNPERLVRGGVRANVAYIPRSSMCGFVNIQEAQIISSIYQRYTVKYLSALTRNKLVLIRRTGGRAFTQQAAIEEVVEKAASDYNLQYVMYKDNPAPSLNDTMLMFHSAVMIVAPHGAGLANMMFSQQGTYIVEGLCNTPHINLCFQRTAVVLGHHYHGIPSLNGCERVVDISAKDIDNAVRAYLEIIKSKSKD